MYNTINFEYQSNGGIMLEKIKKVLVEAINVSEDLIKPESLLQEDLDIDSIAAVELALELETEFNITIDDETLVKLKTVQDIIDVVEKKLTV